VPEAPRVDSLVGEEAIILDDLDPGAVGKGELRGTTWTVRTAGDRTLRRGERARVARVDGLTLWLDA
jgi:membrane protein implicated in regulation of membrane protease activity